MEPPNKSPRISQTPIPQDGQYVPQDGQNVPQDGQNVDPNDLEEPREVYDNITTDRNEYERSNHLASNSESQTDVVRSSYLASESARQIEKGSCELNCESQNSGEEKEIIYLGKIVESYDDVRALVKDFQDTSNCILTVRSSKRNEFSNMNKEKFPKHFVHYHCTHGLDARHRGKGLRNHEYNDSKCPFRLHFKLVQYDANYKVTAFINEHNHELSQNRSAMHPRNRILDKTEAKKYGHYLTELNVTKSKVREAIREETAKLTTTKDLSNLETKLMAGKYSKSDIEETVKILSEKQMEDNGATIKLSYENVGEENILKVVFFQSAKMKKYFQKFGQVLLLDGTYNLTNTGYILITFQTIDNHGITRLVGWSFISSESKDILSEALRHFRDANKDIEQILQFVVIDKDFSEINALYEVLPFVHFIICRFHAIKAVNRYVGNLVLDMSNQHLKLKMKNLFQHMLYAPTEDLYFESWHELCSLAKVNSTADNAVKYFHNYWHVHRQNFARHCLKKKEILATFTNNRSENFNKQIKDIVRRKTKMHKVVEILFLMENEQKLEKLERDWKAENKIYLPYDCLDDCDKDEIIKKGNKLLSKPILREILDQYDRLFQVNATGLNFERGQISCPLLAGACTMSASKGLPCRHLFFCRKQNNETMLDNAMIPKRWLISSCTEEFTNEFNNENIFCEIKSKKSKLNIDKERYNLGGKVLKELASQLSKGNDIELYTKMKLLSELEVAWNNNENILLTEQNSYGLPIAKQEPISEESIAKQISGLQKIISQCPKKELQSKLGFLAQIENGWNRNLTMSLELCLSEPSEPKLEPSWKFESKKVNKLSKNSNSTKNQIPKRQGGIKMVPNPTNELENKLHDWMVENNQMFRLMGATTFIKEDFQKLSDQTLTGTRAFLSDLHMEHLTVMLKNQFPELQSLQITSSYKFAGFHPIDPLQNFIQPIHAGFAHWVTLTNVGVPTNERFNTVYLYDSLVNMSTGSGNSYVERSAIDWQVAQLYMNKHFPDKHFIIKVQPSPQQSNSWDCGIITIANCISLAFNKNPSTLNYIGNLRLAFLNMIKKGAVTMFDHEERNSSNENRFRTVHRTKLITKYVEVPELTHAFQIVCDCKMPPSWGDLLFCDKCNEQYHQKCYLIGNVQLASNIESFLCYNCRIPGNYDFSSIKEKTNVQDVSEMAERFQKMPPYKLGTYVPLAITYGHKKMPETMKDYQEMESIMIKYDFNSIALGRGPLYISFLNYYTNNVREMAIEKNFNDLSIPARVHLCLLLVCSEKGFKQSLDL